MEQIKMNHLAVWSSVIFLFVLGFLWYGPIFGEKWLAMVGITMEEAEANPPSGGVWAANVFSSAFGVYILAWILVQINVQSAVKGAMIGLLIGLAFNLFPTMVNGFFARDPYGEAWITGGFQTVGWTVSGLILGIWTKKA